MKPYVITASLITLLLSACAGTAGTNSSAGAEVCDVVTPPIGSRVPQTVLCEPKKAPAKATS